MHLTTTAVTNVEQGKNEQTPEAANCFVCSRHYDSFSWHSIYILEFSMTTIDNIMALHDEAAKWKAEHYWQEDRGTSDEVFAEVEKRMKQSREALRAALTDALDHIVSVNDMVAQPVREPLNEADASLWLPKNKMDFHKVLSQPAAPADGCCHKTVIERCPECPFKNKA